MTADKTSYEVSGCVYVPKFWHAASRGWIVGNNALNKQRQSGTVAEDERRMSNERNFNNCNGVYCSFVHLSAPKCSVYRSTWWIFIVYALMYNENIRLRSANKSPFLKLVMFSCAICHHIDMKQMSSISQNVITCVGQYFGTLWRCDPEEKVKSRSLDRKDIGSGKGCLLEGLRQTKTI